MLSFKAHVRRLEDTKRRMAASAKRLSADGKESKLEREMLLRANLELAERMHTLRD